LTADGRGRTQIKTKLTPLRFLRYLLFNALPLKIEQEATEITEKTNAGFYFQSAFIGVHLRLILFLIVAGGDLGGGDLVAG
jgi:hypothetical protein